MDIVNHFVLLSDETSEPWRRLVISLRNIEKCCILVISKCYSLCFNFVVQL